VRAQRIRNNGVRRFALLVARAGAGAQPAPDYAALLAAPDRSDADRQADKRRDPAPFLAFAVVRPGMKVHRR
jgi:predicted methyltransferase